MAILFVSPKKKQKIFFWIMMTVLLLFVFIISFITFLPEINSRLRLVDEAPIAVGSFPDIKIDFAILDLPQVINFQSFEMANPDNQTSGRENPFSAYYQPVTKK